MMISIEELLIRSTFVRVKESIKGIFNSSEKNNKEDKIINLTIVTNYSNNSIKDINKLIKVKEEEYEFIKNALEKIKDEKSSNVANQELEKVFKEIEILKKERDQITEELKNINHTLNASLDTNNLNLASINEDEYLEIKKLIQKSKLAEAMNALRNIVLESNIDEFNQFTLLEFRYNHLEKQRKLGIVTVPEFNLEITKWILSTLGFIDEIKSQR